MRAAIVTHSSTFEERAEAVALFFQKKGYTVVRVFSDFDHHRKCTVNREEKDHVYIHMKPYTRNLSLGRMRSIHQFARDAGAYLASGDFDLLYIMLPANTFAEEAERIHKEQGARVIFDLIDLWPESLPLKAVSWLPPLQMWKNLRDQHIGCADIVFTECGFYRNQLDLPKNRTYTLYWCKYTRNNVPDVHACVNMQGREFRIAYIGAINHIIDIPRIVCLLEALNRRVHLIVDIIGEGEQRERFVAALMAKGIQTVYHGAIYEEDRKAEILSRCCLGLNVMRTDVHVGLSMKSIEYLSDGIPLINSIKGDLWDFVSRYGIGVNIPDNLLSLSGHEMNLLCDSLCTVAKDPEAHRRAVQLYRDNFTPEAFNRTMERAITEQLKMQTERK
ncbi:MAG: hypothetical protein LIV24_03565 [Eubacterium sp.]|nr:hypothetical protein [Eubacterium sp.]